MADLRTNPNLNRMQIDKAFESLRNRPNLGRAFADTPIDIRLGDVRGRGFGETYCQERQVHHIIQPQVIQISCVLNYAKAVLMIFAVREILFLVNCYIKWDQLT